MGVESIELDTVNLRMVARTLPGKQYEVGRRLRVLVVRALRRAGIVASDGSTPRWSRAIPHRRRPPARREETQARAGAEAMTSWLKAKLGGRFRASTAGADRRVRRAVLGAADLPAGRRHPRQPAPAVVPPGFVPDPNYTWVPRTQVRRPKEPVHDHHHDDDHDDRDDDAGADGRRPARRRRARRRRWSIRTAQVARSAPQTLTQTPTVTAPPTAPPVAGPVPATPEAPR